MPALSRFLKDELARRGWQMEEFATRATISLSNAYLIVRDGKDNVRRETFENIAGALGMTPAELFAATTDADDRELAVRQAQFGAALRGIPREFWGAVLKASVSLAESLPSTGVTAHDRTSVSSPDESANKVDQPRTPDLPKGKHRSLGHLLANVTG